MAMTMMIRAASARRSHIVRCEAAGLAAAAEALGKAREKIVGHLGRSPVDQTRADLRQLAADLRRRAVLQARARAVGRERDARFAAGEAGGPALAFEAHSVRGRGDDVGEQDATAE